VTKSKNNTLGVSRKNFLKNLRNGLEYVYIESLIDMNPVILLQQGGKRGAVDLLRL
jgi:hypothetical protein